MTLTTVSRPKKETGCSKFGCLLFLILVGAIAFRAPILSHLRRIPIPSFLAAKTPVANAITSPSPSNTPKPKAPATASKKDTPKFKKPASSAKKDTPKSKNPASSTKKDTSKPKKPASSKKTPVPNSPPTPAAKKPSTFKKEQPIDAAVKAAAQKTVKGLDSEEKKARALFEWVAKNVQYDVPAYVSKNKPAQSAGAVLTRGSAVAQGYANLYQDMARAVGLKCEVITGIVRKRDRYDSSVEQDRHHVWNAVLVNGHWILVDPTWASGSSDLSALTFKYRFNPQWYDVAPERMIYTHLPDKDKWQLRKDRPPLSQNDFDQLPMAYSGYFHSGLKAKSHPFPQFKAGKYLELQFTSEKRIELSGTLLTHKGERFQRSYVTSQSQGYEHSLYVSIPQDGAYDLWVHTKLPGQDYEPALLYVINAQGIRRSFLGF